jgi:hypothetical protein
MCISGRNIKTFFVANGKYFGKVRVENFREVLNLTENTSGKYQ